MTLTLTPNTLATLVISRMAIREWPPSSKKFDVGPISGTCKTSRQIAAILVSAPAGSTLGGELGHEVSAPFAGNPPLDMRGAILSRTGGTSEDNRESGVEIA